MTHCSDTLYTYIYLDKEVLPDSTRNIFLYSPIFCMHSLCANVRVLLWKFFYQSYCSLCRVWGVKHCFYYDSLCSGNFFRIPRVLQNTRNKVSCIWSFYNCKISPNRFFINSFDKYIFKFKLDILFFEFNLFIFTLILFRL